MACCTDATFVIPDNRTDAATVGLQVNEFGFQRPASVGRFVAEVQEALIDLNVVLALDVGGLEFVHGLRFGLGLVNFSWFFFSERIEIFGVFRTTVIFPIPMLPVFTGGINAK